MIQWNPNKNITTFWRFGQSLNSIDNTANEQGDELTLLNLKINYKATIIKRACYFKTNRYTDKWNRIESPRIDLCIDRHLDFGQSPTKVLQHRKDGI